MPAVVRQPLKRQRFSSLGGDGDYSFAYTKACGIIGKSFVGKRAAALKGVRTLREFDQLVFPEPRHDVPDKELLVNLEKRIEKRAFDQIAAIVKACAQPPELLIRQLEACDKRDSPPKDGADIAQIEIERDSRYYFGLIKSLRSLSDDDRFIAQRILFDEISLRNCTWALRLRAYFRKNPAEAAGCLMKAPSQIEGAKNFTAAALASLKLPLDTRASWRGWKWEKFLNPEKQGEHWNVDPRYFQNAALRYLYRRALSRFHHAPMAVSSIFCFIKLVQAEEELLTSIVEGLSMDMGAADVFALLEVAL